MNSVLKKKNPHHSSRRRLLALVGVAFMPAASPLVHAQPANPLAVPVGDTATTPDDEVTLFSRIVPSCSCHDAILQMEARDTLAKATGKHGPTMDVSGKILAGASPARAAAGTLASLHRVVTVADVALGPYKLSSREGFHNFQATPNSRDIIMTVKGPSGPEVIAAYDTTIWHLHTFAIGNKYEIVPKGPYANMVVVEPIVKGSRPALVDPNSSQTLEGAIPKEQMKELLPARVRAGAG